MTTNKSKYDAIIMDTLVKDNIRLQSIKEIVEEAILNSTKPIKKSELDHIVSLKTNLSIDSSIVGAVAGALQDLLKRRIAKQAHMHGYWEKY